MKIMATSCPIDEQLFPMLPTLWAMRNAGHDVLVALPAKLAKATAATGLPTTAIADDIDVSMRERTATPTTITDLADLVTDLYVPIAEQTVQRTVAVAEAWRPDLVLCSDWEYAGQIAAAAVGAPTVLHGKGLLPHPGINARVAEALAPLHIKWGLSSGAPDHWKVIDNCPPSLQWTTPPPNAVPSRYVGFHKPGELPSWVFEQPEMPRVLVAIGNNPLLKERTGVLRTITQALLPLDIEVIIATSEQLGGDRLIEVPRRTRLTHGLPWSHLMPTCAVVINDGNASTAVAAAVAGVPQLGLPQVPGQHQYAERIAEVGAGLALAPEDASVTTIKEATETLLNELGQRAIARRLQVENDERPGLNEVVKSVERAHSDEEWPTFTGRVTATPTQDHQRRWQPSRDIPTTPVAHDTTRHAADEPHHGTVA